MKASNDIYLAAAFLGHTEVTELILSFGEKNPTVPPEFYKQLLQLSKSLFHSPPYEYDQKTKSYDFTFENQRSINNISYIRITVWSAKDFFSRAAIDGNREYNPTWLLHMDLSVLNPYATILNGEEMPAKCKLLESLLEFAIRDNLRKYGMDDEGDLDWGDWVDVYEKVARNVNFDFKRMQKSILGNVQLWNKFSKAFPFPLGKFTINGTTYIGLLRD